ncbi:MAG: class F420-dependent oxidoreductase [Subtercola sp.]|nr:class F420-dependent oxidoreductase [Subtercola sp.]
MRAVKHFDTWIGAHEFGEIGQLIESLGFDAVSVAEHPYPPDAWLADGGHHAFDPFVALSAWSAVTHHITLMTAILVAGYRSPYLLAKAVSSLDFISGGRVVLGMGAGYLKGEFDVLGADFADRGAVLDETIPAMRATWSGDDFAGTRFPAFAHTALPLPKQAGGPPIWVGGNSAAARRRVITRVEGWLPIAQNETMAAITRTPALTSLADLAGHVAEVNASRAALGRGPADVAFTPFESSLLRGGSMNEYCDVLIPRLDGYAAAGITWLTIEPTSRSFEAFCDDLTTLATRLRLVSDRAVPSGIKHNI